MRFVVRGSWQGRDVEVVWDGGELSGPEEIVSLLHVHAGLRADGLGPPLESPGDGSNYDAKGVANPMATLLLVEQLLDEVYSVSNEPEAGLAEMRARHMLRGLKPE